MKTETMARPKRVLSFMTQWANGPHRSNTGDSSTAVNGRPVSYHSSNSDSPPRKDSPDVSSTSIPPSPVIDSTPRKRANTTDSRASSNTFYNPPVMEVADDVLPELQPIFMYLNSHANKLYQEGYFLKLHDLDSRGRPSPDRVWNECFAQLVGTVLSLWDAAALDAAGEDGEVIPTFINLTDASIKMIESLPMNGVDGQSLQNVLSVSTAANNRYLLHFNSLHSLTQWTAGIRLAMFEHATLQEAYTGSILAGKGKYLNGIKTIMERQRFVTEDWARVRFGAGTPWRRCWCVITPPDEKEFTKAQKQKKKSAYDRSIPVIKGDIKFYENRKITKKSRPIATITDAYSAYAVYPQNKELIDRSTLVKVEGDITIHSNPETSTEGFVFVMPEVHPAISGFETMLRWLLPTYDTFALYGRPSRLVADVLDTRSLMFAMPTGRRYGYLELIDVASLIHTEGSHKWSDREWRKQMKQLTSKRMAQPTDPNRSGTDVSNRRLSRSSLNNLPSHATRSSTNLPSQNRVKFGGGESGMASAPGSRHGSPITGENPFKAPSRVDSAPVGAGSLPPHKRAVSETTRYIRRGPAEPSRLSFEQGVNGDNSQPPPVPAHASSSAAFRPDSSPLNEHYYSADEDAYGSDYGSENRSAHNSYSNGYAPAQPAPRPDDFRPHLSQPHRPVAAPPNMSHASAQRPPHKPTQRPDIRRANSAIDAETLEQLNEANRAGRGRSSSGAYDDMNRFGQTPPPGSSMLTPMGSANYNPSAGAGYMQQVNAGSSGGYSTAPGMRERRGPPPPDARKLPTIPGTPAVEQDQPSFPSGGRPQSSTSVKRKPVPGNGPAGIGGAY